MEGFLLLDLCVLVYFILRLVYVISDLSDKDRFRSFYSTKIQPSRFPERENEKSL